MSVTNYQKMIAEAMKKQDKPVQKKLIKFSFSQYKEKMKSIDQHKSHVSIDGFSEIVTVKFLK